MELKKDKNFFFAFFLNLSVVDFWSNVPQSLE
jgi:hypothetical protein